MDGPRRRFDPLALAVNGVALAALVVVGGYLAVSLWRYQPPSPKPPIAAKPATAKPPVAAQPAPPVAPVARPPVRRFELVDMRPRKEKIDFDPGEQYGYVVVGDASIDRLAVLRERLAAQVGHRLEGKQVEVQQLLTWHVRTLPQGVLMEAAPGMQPMRQEDVWHIPELRKFRYWVICDLAVLVDGRRASARGVAGFDAQADFPVHHQRALRQAIDGVASAL